MEETNAFSPLNNLIMQQQNVVSPTKQPLMNDKLLEMVRAAMQNGQLQGFPQQQPPTTQFPMPMPMTTDGSSSSDMNASPSAASSSDDMYSQDGDNNMMMDQQQQQANMLMMQQQQQQNQQMNGGFQPTPLQQLTIDSSANIAAGALSNTEQRSCGGRHETWLECFTTTKLAEYEALLFSVYVTERNERKFDGWTYFDCLHRLQSKCRYRVRTRQQDEFYIVEEKGVHNHGAVEPVGQAGSHAGLPKTIREIVDRSYNENWTLDDRTIKIDEEIQRLGLPANPRLGRQIDNRVAYLRRVKNLHESRRIQDHVNGSANGGSATPFTDSTALQEAMLNPAMLEALMEKNGGQLTVEKGMVEQILSQQLSAAAAAAPKPMETEIVKPVALNQNPEFYQQLIHNAQGGQNLSPEHTAALLALAHQSMIGGQENIQH